MIGVDLNLGMIFLVFPDRIGGDKSCFSLAKLAISDAKLLEKTCLKMKFLSQKAALAYFQLRENVLFTFR